MSITSILRAGLSRVIRDTKRHAQTTAGRFLVCFVLATVPSWAACTVSGSTLTAASPAETDVSACLQLLAPGDTIVIPPGSATWTSELNLSLAKFGSGTFSITGSGTANSGSSTFGAGATTTTITDNSGGNPIFNVTLAQGQTFELSLLNIYPQSASTQLTSPIFAVGTCNSSGCPEIRFDNLNFGSTWSENGNGTQSSWLIRTDNVFGVLDHNTIGAGSGVTLGNIHHSSWMGVGEYGDNSWSQPDSFGTANALFFENNSVSTSLMAGIQDCDETPGTTGGGCRIVVRYNQFSMAGGSMLYFHGTDSTDRVRGGRQGEVYGNTITCTSTSSGCATGANLRSGVVLNYSNTYKTSSGSWFNNLMELDEYRSWASFPPWGWCDGTGPYDNNDSTIYASGTIKSVSTSGGTLVIGDSSQNWSSNQWLNNGFPYSIVDTTASAGYEITGGSSNSVSANNYGNDYYNGPPSIKVGDSYQIRRASVCMDQPSRSGGTYLSGTTPATGWVNQVLDPSYEWNDNISGATVFHGTVGSDTAKIIANRDYYTQTSSFNGSSGTGVGVLSARPSSCTPNVAYWATDTNTLYKCTATNTWSAYYRPYTYPHPLTQSLSAGSGTAPAPPTALTVVAQ